jgi:predicted dithiol-disulfide oxidoreductase (DUF899 family)
MTPIQQLEREIADKIAALNELRKAAPPIPVPEYIFETDSGPATLRSLFGDKTTLFAIHNMGQGCRYCTLWADGFTGLVTHLESQYAFVLLSKDPPLTQRAFALSRGWNFRMASHRGGPYIREQTVMPGKDNAPGMVCYERRGDAIFRKNAVPFGPGDLYSPLWHMLSLAGHGTSDFVPQFAYWQRPQQLDDGGKGVRG